jgi:hypothetical protein
MNSASADLPGEDLSNRISVRRGNSVDVADQLTYPTKQGAALLRLAPLDLLEALSLMRKMPLNR